MLGSRRGFILAVAFLAIIVLSLFIFSYNMVARHQNFEMHSGSISEVTCTLALNGVGFLADHFNENQDEVRKILDSKGMYGTPGAFPNCDLFLENEGWLRDLKGEYNRNLGKWPEPERVPVCTQMDVRIIATGIFPIHSQPDRVSLQNGFDLVEKEGVIELSCTVRFCNFSRKARALRHYKLVSMIPGPYCRFTLFSVSFRDPNGFNIVRQNPSEDLTAAGGAGFGQLVLFNSPAPDSSHFPGTAEEMAQRQDVTLESTLSLFERSGWVYLGENRDPDETPAPAQNPREVEGSPILNIPFGSGNFMLGPLSFRSSSSNPASSEQAPKPRNRPFSYYSANYPFEGIVENHLRSMTLQFSGICSEGEAGQTFADYSKQFSLYLKPASKEEPDRGAILAKEDCFSSWILPFGRLPKITPTLLFGHASARFLALILLRFTEEFAQECFPNDRDLQSASHVFLPPRSGFQERLDPDTVARTQILSAPPLPGNRPTYGDIFRPCPSKPGSTILDSINHFTRPFPEPRGIIHLPFNLLYDMMAGQTPNFEDFTSFFQNGIAGLRETGLVCPYNENPDPNQRCGFWEASGVTLWKYGKPVDRGDPGKTLFSGDLPRLHFHPEMALRSPDPFTGNLYYRITHFIDLRGQTNSEAVEGVLSNRIFSKKTGPDRTDYYEFSRPGIFLLDTGGRDLTIDRPVILKNSGMLILLKGNINVKKTITGDHSEDRPGELPNRHLFSLVSCTGNIRIPPNLESPLEAYLVALCRSGPADPPVGQIESSDPQVKGQMNIFGGCAVYRLQPASPQAPTSTMTDFPLGGQITYNPMFNPSRPWEPGTSRPDFREYAFVLDDFNREIVFGPGDPGTDQGD